MSEELKTCACGDTKPLSDFYDDRCIDCAAMDHVVIDGDEMNSIKQSVADGNISFDATREQNKIGAGSGNRVQPTAKQPKDIKPGV